MFNRQYNYRNTIATKGKEDQIVEGSVVLSPSETTQIHQA